MVAMNVWPTDASDGSVANEARWRKMARYWQPSGVVSGLSPSLAYPNLTIQAGTCWVDGHFCELLGSQVLTVTANGLAVVRFDPAANTAELLYRAGATTPQQSPTGVYEIPIAVIAGSALTVDARALVDPAGGMLFGTPQARDLNLPAPPDGLVVQTAGGVLWNRVAGAWLSPNRIVTGAVLGATLPADQTLTRTVSDMTLPSSPSKFLVIYTVLVSSTVGLNVLFRMYGTWAAPNYQDYQISSAAGSQSLTFVALANAGAGLSIYGSSRSGTLASTYADGVNHQLLAIGLA